MPDVSCKADEPEEDAYVELGWRTGWTGAVVEEGSEEVGVDEVE